jgi:hypothetical protein
MRRALVIVGKAPRAGGTKTRLVPPLSPEEAADLYRAFLLDAVQLGLGLDWECVTVVHPAGASEAHALAQLLPAEVRRVAQTGRGLGDAFSSAFARHFREGFDQVVLMASDSPSLPAEVLESAADALAVHDVCIGPSVDGGYYLIGLRRPCPDVFAGIDWSTPRVFEQTLDRAGRLELSIHVLPEWFDVDGPADLERLRADLAARPSAVAPHTRAVLAHLAPTQAGDVVRS